MARSLCASGINSWMSNYVMLHYMARYTSSVSSMTTVQQHITSNFDTSSGPILTPRSVGLFSFRYDMQHWSWLESKHVDCNHMVCVPLFHRPWGLALSCSGRWLLTFNTFVVAGLFFAGCLHQSRPEGEQRQLGNVRQEAWAAMSFCVCACVCPVVLQAGSKHTHSYRLETPAGRHL